MQQNQETGYLRVQAVTADGAFPVEGAAVIVTDSDGGTVASLRTDRSGLTETIPLFAPSASLSQAPENGGTLPYSTYTVEISKDGFYPVEDYSVPVFDGITSIQRANMIPLTEFSPLPPNPRPQTVETPGYDELNGGDGK